MSVAEIADTDRRLALAFAPSRVRSGLAALWALDEALGRAIASTSEPLIGQMRMTWWHERLRALDGADAPGEPVLRGVEQLVRRHDVTGAELAGLVEGWEALLEPLPLRSEPLYVYARGRGGTLMRLSARLLASDTDAAGGEGWALADFARHCSDADTAARAQAMARDRLDRARDPQAKPLRILIRLVRGDSRRPVGAPRPRRALLSAVFG